MSLLTKKLAGTVGGAALLITVLTLCSRIIGFGRWIGQAKFVGSGGVAESYAVANLLPNVLYEVAVGGALAGAIIPLLAGFITKNDQKQFNRYASVILNWVLVILIPLAILVVILAPFILSFVPHLESGTKHDVAVVFLRIFAAQIPLYGISVVLTGVLQSKQKFLWPALMPIVSSILVIASYAVFAQLAQGNQQRPELLSSNSIQILGWGTTAGVFALSVPLFWPAFRSGYRYQLAFKMPRELFKKSVGLMSAGLGALFAQQVSVLAVMFATNKFGGSGAFNIYQYSQAIYVLPYAIFAVPLATSVFPRIAAEAAKPEQSQLSALISKTTALIIALASLGVGLLVVNAAALERFFALFTKGRTHDLGALVLTTALGLIGYSLLFHLTRVLYAFHRNRVAAGAAIAGWLTVAGLSVVLPAVFVSGKDYSLSLILVGLSSSIGMSVTGFMLLRGIKTLLANTDYRFIYISIFKSLVALGISGGLTVLLAKHLPNFMHETTLIGVISYLVVVSLLLLIGYGGITFALQKSIIVGILKRK